MANVIEIRVRATDETAAVYDKVKAASSLEGRDSGAAFTSAFATHMRGEGGQDISNSLAASLASGTGSVHAGAGEQIADEIVDSISDTIGRDLPAKVKDPIEKSGSGSGAAFVGTFQGSLDQGLSSSALSGIGRSGGEKFSASFSAGAKDGIQDANLGALIGAALGQDLEDEIPAVIGPSSPAGTRLKDEAKKSGEQAGEAAGEGMSPILASALAGAAAVGAPALLAGMGAAFAGVTALALRSNVVIKNDFATLGTDASKALSAAAAPAAGTLHQALVGLEGTVQQLTPELKGLFVNAEPDVTALTAGVGAFASGVLPGLSSALKNSQVIVGDFGNSLGPLGQNVGGFFQGLTRDAYTTGAGMQSLLGVVGHLANTLGGVLGSAASVGSTALMGLDPVLNSTLSLVQKISSPGTVGAAAGLFAGLKFDSSISSGLKSAAGGMETLALKSMDASGAFGKMAPALEKTSGALSAGAGVMAGPWGLAIDAGIGLAVGLAGALINASHASDALTLSQQGLQDAVAKDNGQIGSATSAYVAAQAQTDGLAKSAAQAGVSLDTWTQAVLGNKDAQKQVTDAVMTSNQSTLNAQEITESAAQSTGKFSDEQRDAQTAVTGQASATNRLTDQNKQLLASMQAQNQQIAAAVTKQAQLQAATNALTNSTQIFAASLKASYQAQVGSAQQSALTSVASMNLGDTQTTLSQKIYQTETAYNLATAAAQGYSTELQALNGTADNLAQAQSTVDQQMVTAKSTFQQNGYAIDGMTKGAVANRAALNQMAVSIQALGVAQYQATGNINKGNQTIQQQITAFVNATGATGKAKTAIEQYLESLAKIPPGRATSITADTGPATSSLQRLIEKINRSSASITVYENSSGEVFSSGGGSKAKATGGNIGAAATGGARGNLVLVGEQGPELARLPFGTTVIPHSNVQSMAASGGGGAASAAVGGRVDVGFSGNTSDAVAAMFMNLVRTGKIQIRMSQIRNN